MDIRSVGGVAIASVMKLGHKMVELQFATQRPDSYSQSNDTCQQLNATSRAALNSGQSVITWIYTVRYMLPVLGGVLSTACLGYVRVLQMGGLIMLLSTVLMSVAVYQEWVCSQPVACLAIWLMLPVIFALVHPTVMHAIFRWHRRPSMRTVASAVYCGSAVLGECLGWLLPLLDTGMGPNVTVIGIAISVLFMGLSFTLREEAKYSMPTRARMIRYAKIFAALIIFMIAVADTRPAVYRMELTHYLNAAGDHEDVNAQVWSPEVLKLTSLTGTCLALALIAAALPSRQIPVKARIQAGILLESAVSLTLVMTNLVQVSDAAAIRGIYVTASTFDGIATGLTMVAAYELMDMMADRSIKPLVIGIVFTVLGIANILSRLLLLAFSALPSGSPVLNPPQGERRPMFFVYHLTILVLLILGLVYHQCISFRLASTMIAADPEPDVTEQEETRPLIGIPESDSST